MKADKQAKAAEKAEAKQKKSKKGADDTAVALKKPKSPLSVGNIFLGILLFLVLTFIVLYAVLFIVCKSYDFVGVSKNMSDQLGLTPFFTKIGAWFSGLFKK
mgnify:CR=1 FL=1